MGNVSNLNWLFICILISRMFVQSDTKEQGERIVDGEEVFVPKKVGPKAP